MRGFLYTWFRSSLRKLQKALHTPTPVERWLATVHPSTSIHAITEWRGRIPSDQCITIGKGCLLEQGLSVWLSDDPGNAAKLTIGDRVYVGRNTFVGVYQPITIGEYVLIGAYCYIISANHNSTRRDVPICDQGYVGAPVQICRGAWLGTHVVILPGVTIGEGAIVGAGSVVTKSVPPYQIWGGVPARFIKERPGEGTLPHVIGD
jgi:maltose O-acetyltransferase